MEYISIILGAIGGLILNQLWEHYNQIGTQEVPQNHKLENHRFINELIKKITDLDNRLTKAGEHFTKVDNRRFQKMTEIHETLRMLIVKIDANVATYDDAKRVINQIEPKLKELDEIEKEFKKMPDKIKM